MLIYINICSAVQRTFIWWLLLLCRLSNLEFLLFHSKMSKFHTSTFSFDFYLHVCVSNLLDRLFIIVIQICHYFCPKWEIQGFSVCVSNFEAFHNSSIWQEPFFFNLIKYYFEWRNLYSVLGLEYVSIVVITFIPTIVWVLVWPCMKARILYFLLQIHFSEPHPAVITAAWVSHSPLFTGNTVTDLNLLWRS